MLLSALYIGVTFGIYRSSGKIPLTIERLNKYFKCSHNSPKHFFITLKLAPSWRRLGQSLGQSLSHLDHPFTITGHTLSRSQDNEVPIGGRLYREEPLLWCLVIQMHPNHMYFVSKMSVKPSLDLETRSRSL